MQVEPGKIRTICDYCRRTVTGKSRESISCTSCGHGRMKEVKPKNWCSICGEPQYDNVSEPPVRVECDLCVYRNTERMRRGGILDLRPDVFHKISGKRKKALTKIHRLCQKDSETASTIPEFGAESHVGAKSIGSPYTPTGKKS
jgi:hypothetical protein